MGKQYWTPGTMLSCQRPEEKPNIITVAWSGTINTNLPMLYISVRKSRYSYDIIRETGEFVVNLVTKKLVFAADYCGVRSGRDVDKFGQMKLTPLPSQTIKAPGILQSPVNIECKVKEILSLGSHDMFLSEVTSVTVDDKYIDKNGKFHLNRSGLAVYSHGEYFELGERLGKFGYSVEKPAGKRKKHKGAVYEN